MKTSHFYRLQILRKTNDLELKMHIIALAEILAETVTEEELETNLLRCKELLLNGRLPEFRKNKKGKKSKPKREYDTYISSEEWENKKKECFALKGKMCQFCGSITDLHVHHATYKNLKKEDVENDLYVLCNKCHFQYHKLYPPSKTTIQRTRDFIGLDRVFK